MNKVILQILIGVILMSCSTTNDQVENIPVSCDFIDFKYYHDTQSYLGEMSNEYLILGIDVAYTDAQIQIFISNLQVFDQTYNYTIYQYGSYDFKEIPLKLTTARSCEQITQIIVNLEHEQMISYAHYAMDTDHCTNPIGQIMGSLCVNSYGSSFFVKVFDENNLSDLHQVMNQTNTFLVEQNQFMPKWFELKAVKDSNGDGLAMANYFHETGLFEHSEPGISKYAVE